MPKYCYENIGYKQEGSTPFTNFVKRGNIDVIFKETKSK